MTLKEKFWKVTVYPFTEYREREQMKVIKEENATECEKIADDFAIEFKDWCDNEGRFTIGVNTTKELLQIYKKEKGL
jgi:hypothetical protein